MTCYRRQQLLNCVDDERDGWWQVSWQLIMNIDPKLLEGPRSSDAANILQCSFLTSRSPLPSSVLLHPDELPTVTLERPER